MEWTGVVLAGGAATRFRGNKALALLHGKPLAAHVVERMAAAGPREILVTVPAEQEEHYAFLRKHAAVPLRVEADLRSGGGPLAGIEAGLTLMRTRALVAAGCDQPFLAPALLQSLLEHSPGTDAVAFETNGTLQPLPALYGKGCVPEIKMLLRQAEAGPTDLLKAVEAKVLPEAEARKVDPELASFGSIDTKEELEAAGR